VIPQLNETLLFNRSMYNTQAVPIFHSLVLRIHPLVCASLLPFLKSHERQWSIRTTSMMLQRCRIEHKKRDFFPLTEPCPSWWAATVTINQLSNSLQVQIKFYLTHICERCAASRINFCINPVQWTLMPSSSWQPFYSVTSTYRLRLHWHWDDISLKTHDWRIVIVLIDR
jgi:hypothetical protein